VLDDAHPARGWIRLGQTATLRSNHGQANVILNGALSGRAPASSRSPTAICACLANLGQCSDELASRLTSRLHIIGRQPKPITAK
jgi:hypothetical protein